MYLSLQHLLLLSCRCFCSGRLHLYCRCWCCCHCCGCFVVVAAIAVVATVIGQQYNAPHAVTVSGRLSRPTTTIRHTINDPRQPANLDAEAMKYLAQTAAANAAKEMARPESWAQASMCDEARTENSSLLPLSEQLP
jgi:hypothetical protein